MQLIKYIKVYCKVQKYILYKFCCSCCRGVCVHVCVCVCVCVCVYAVLLGGFALSLSLWDVNSVIHDDQSKQEGCEAALSVPHKGTST